MKKDETEKEKGINLNSMTKKELIAFIISQDNQDTRPIHNRIELGDISVDTTESLSTCEQTINRMIDKHKRFVAERKAERMLNNSMYSSGIG